MPTAIALPCFRSSDGIILWYRLGSLVARKLTGLKGFLFFAAAAADLARLSSVLALLLNVSHPLDIALSTIHELVSSRGKDFPRASSPTVINDCCKDGRFNSWCSCLHTSRPEVIKLALESE
ncbi:hypothetical protein ElyMa_001163400 [Elysia marginata]|uniref:Uncharacterized protein n=1 Tax=Elysia marginata TaxID=1093978 RepID=A0AAV4I4Q2_9GAST|nr:hypothetical protein ElyMa_001163400 [Elysia marginata]